MFEKLQALQKDMQFAQQVASVIQELETIDIDKDGKPDVTQELPQLLFQAKDQLGAFMSTLSQISAHGNGAIEVIREKLNLGGKASGEAAGSSS